MEKSSKFQARIGKGEHSEVGDYVIGAQEKLLSKTALPPRKTSVILVAAPTGAPT